MVKFRQLRQLVKAAQMGNYRYHHFSVFQLIALVLQSAALLFWFNLAAVCTEKKKHCTPHAQQQTQDT